MKIIFAKTEYHYDSYTDFWKLVELAGFETCFVKDVDLENDAVYITTPINGELRPHVNYRRSILKGPQRARIIWWNLERPDSGAYEINQITGTEVINSTNDILKHVDRVWVSDRYYQSLDPRMIYVTAGGDARLSPCAPDPMKVYDIAALTYNNHRRDQIYGPLGGRWKMAPNSAWGENRALILNRSRCMVYVHQTPSPIGAPLRFVLAAAHKLPLICETMADPYPLQAGRDFLMCHHNQMLPQIEAWLAQGYLSQIGENLFKTLCVDFPFRKCVEEGLARTFA